MLPGEGAFGVENRVCSSNSIFSKERDRRPMAFFPFFPFFPIFFWLSIFPIFSHFAFLLALVSGSWAGLG